MAFKRGKDYRLFITTENDTGSIAFSGGTGSLVATTSSGWGPNATLASLGIGNLGDVSSTASEIGEIKNIEAIEPTWAYADDPMTVFGQARPLDNPIRKTWELTVTRLGENNLFGKLAEGARFGVTGTAPGIFNGLSTMPGETGYRLYLWTGDSFYVGYQGTIKADGYKETLTPTGVTRQAITFAGGNWSASLGTGSEITASVSITQ